MEKTVKRLFVACLVIFAGMIVLMFLV